MIGFQIYPAKRQFAMVDGNAGKGDKYRKSNQKKWDDGWESAFGKNKKTDPDQTNQSVNKKKRSTTTKEIKK